MLVEIARSAVRRGRIVLPVLTIPEGQTQVRLRLPFDPTLTRPVAVQVTVEQSIDGVRWWPIGGVGSLDLLAKSQQRGKDGQLYAALTFRAKEQVYRDDVFKSESWAFAYDLKNPEDGAQYWQLAICPLVRVTVDSYLVDEKGQKIDDADLGYSVEWETDRRPAPAVPLGHRSAALIGNFTETDGAGALTTGSRTSVAGSLITVHGASWSDSPNNIVLTSNHAGVYTELQNFSIGSGGSEPSMAVAYNIGGTRAASHTLSIGDTGAQSLSASEWSGIEAAPTVVSNTGTSTNTAPTDSQAVGAASLVIAMLIYDGSPTTIAVSDGTQASETDENNDNQAHAVHYKVAQTGTPSITATLGASRNWGTIIAAFTESVSGIVLTPGVGSVPFTGAALSLGIGLGLGAGAVGITGHAPTLVIDKAITIPAGSLAYTGQTALLARGIDFAAGTLAITGLAPTVNVFETITLPAGAVSIAGQAPSLERGLPIPAGSVAVSASPLALGLGLSVPVGQLVVTGQTPALTGSAAIDIPAGSLVFTGQALTLAGTATIPIPAGSLVVTGLAPTSTPAVTVALPAGSVVVTGIAPTLTYALAIPAGALVVTGRTPQIAGTESIAIPAGSLVVTGQALTLSGTATIPIPAGSLPLTGYAPDVLAGRTIEIPVGSLTVTGRYISLAFITPDAGQLVITGYAPTVTATANGEIAIPAGALTCTGYAPSLQFDVVLAVPAGSLVVTGRVPALLGTGEIMPDTGVLVVTGYAPTVTVTSFDYDIAVPVGALALQGYAPSVGLGGFTTPRSIRVSGVTGRGPRVTNVEGI